ncbi:MAG TPA: polysaccharide biosynthesis C-terminal domain-containing protein [Bacilli bacterium]|nr:polysaccharide biosynthesis C-terminal domain-containing protein [Bacilli bacterium]
MNKNQQTKNFIWNMIGLTFNSFNSFFFLIIVKRINGIDTAGIFTYGFAIACLFWGISMYYNRTFQVSSLKINDNTFKRFRLLSCIAMFLITILFVLISGFSLIKLWTVILLCLFRNLEALSDTYYGIIHKNERLDYVGKSLFLKAIIGLGVFLIIDLISKNIILSIIGMILVNLLGLLVDIKTSKKYVQKDNIVEKKNLVKILKDTFPIFIFSFLSVLLLNMQKYMIGYISLDSIQTIFGIIVMPATIMALCGQYLINPFLNSMTKNYNDKKITSLKKQVRNISLTILGLGVFIIIVAYFLCVPVLNIVYDIDLVKYKYLILLILFASILYSVSTIYSACLTIIKRNKEQLYLYVISVIVSLGISFLLIDKTSVSGATYAYSISMIIHAILYYVLYKYSINKLDNKE